MRVELKGSLYFLPLFIVALSVACLLSMDLDLLTDCYRDSEIPESLARDVIKTYKLVSSAVQKLLKG